MKNILLNNNLPVNNSVILNNYSIQNLIISPTNLISNDKSPILANHYFFRNKGSYSPSPHKPILNNILINEIPQNKFLRNLTPITSYKSTTSLNCINLNNITYRPINSDSNQNIMHSPKIQKITKKSEKHPLDSKKIKIKNNQIVLRTDKKILKNSISQRVFTTIKKPYKTTRNETSKTNENLMHCNTSVIKKEPSNTRPIPNEPKGNLILDEFQIAEPIGKGTFGKIFCVRWIKNNKLYALKKEILTDKESVDKRKDAFEIIQNFIKKTKSKGVIGLYSNLLIKNYELESQYYELMEKAERDWDQEINVRAQYNLYYKEEEILNIMKQLISTLALLQKNHITHRDLKPQNILVIDGKYKLCDFGEIRVLKRNGLIVQRVRGSELYMSPILFHGLHLNLIQVKHNTYKSDVFSLGMCLFYASSLTYIGVDSIRELTNMERIKEILFKHLGKRYSSQLIMLILIMLEVNEEKRPDFIHLEMKLKKIFT